MKPLISIIIPVYNVEEIIEECVNSCTGQTYENIEIILVDDGATDDSGVICDQLKEQDSRIKVFHTKNQGVAEARNYGVQQSIGKYITFIDGDDKIENQYVEKLYNLLLDTDADMVGCRFYRNSVNEMIFPIYDEKYNFAVNSEMFLKQFYNDFGVFAPAWGKLSKRELWENLRFPTKSIAEDAPVIRPLAMMCQKIGWTQEALYFYRNRDNSISRTADKRKIEDSLEWIEEDIKYYTQKKMKELKYVAYKAYCFNLLVNWWRVPEELKAFYRKKYIKRAVSMLFHRGNKFLAKIKYLVYIIKLK